MISCCSSLTTAVVAVIVICLAYLLNWFLEPYWTARRKNKDQHRDPQEKVYMTSATSSKSFPHLGSPATCYLSVIIPAYNEEDRLPIMMEETMPYLEKRAAKNSDFTYEVIIVDDASGDNTVPLAMTMVQKYNKGERDIVRVLRLAENHGKGGAIRKGMLRASGEYLLMVDADGATDFQDLEKLEAALVKHNNTAAALAVGSRAHLEETAIAQRHPIRNFLMFGFHFIVSSLFSTGVRDTQCGFKLFDRQSARLIFPAMHIERWAFDVEMLYLAKYHNIRIAEVAVRWQEIPGSKLGVISATLTILREMLLIRLCYAFGLWKVTDGAFRLQLCKE